LRERSFALNGALSLKVKCHSSAHLHPALLHPTGPLSHNALTRVVGVIACRDSYRPLGSVTALQGFIRFDENAGALAKHRDFVGIPPLATETQ